MQRVLYGSATPMLLLINYLFCFPILIFLLLLYLCNFPASAIDRHLIHTEQHPDFTLGLHNALKDKLDLPDYYGENLDALWDCLTGWIELPQTLVWRNFESSKKFLGSYADNTLEVLQRAQKELEDEFKIIIE